MLRKIVVAALGECSHVAGVTNFHRLAEQVGWQRVFLGPAVSITEVLAAARQHGAARAWPLIQQGSRSSRQDAWLA
jgi:methylmalonyl-CoA mutase cobalamin-binding subunit